MPPKKATTGGLWSWQQDDRTYAMFDAKANNVVELAYASTTTGTGTVAAKNMNWDYEYDFDAMTQKNTSTGRVRAIQRVGPVLPAVAAAAAATAAAAAAAHAAKLAADAAAAHAAALQAAADAAATAAGVAAGAGGGDDEDAAPATTAAPLPPTGPVTWSWENDRGEFEAFDAAIAKIVEDAFEIEEGTGKTKREANGFRYEYDFDAMTQRNISSGRVRKLQRSIGGVVVAPAAAKASVAKTAREDSEGEPALKRLRADDDSEPPAPTTAKSTAAALASIGAVAVTTAGGKSVAMTSSGTHGHMQIIKKGRGVVDTHSGLAATSHVLEAGPIVYQCMLNQTNVSANNNKFYVIQVIEKDDKSCVYCFTRWGRVGVPGATNLDAFGSTFAAIQSFEKKFREKTKNAWSVCATDHSKFVKYDGAYQLMTMDLADDQEEDAAPAAAAGAAPAAAAVCTLPPELQRVMRIISNKTVMEGAMRELKIDTRRMPLGKISKAQIKAAYKHLQAISEELTKKKPSGSVIESNTSMFYTLVPHDFGMTRPPLIDDEDTLKRKMDMLDLLAELEIATTLIASGSSSKDHPMDSAYRSLKCPLQVVPHASAVFDRVRRYVKNTHGGTHKNYTLAVENVFEVDRPGELSRFRAGKYDSMEPRMMLWHGSRSANFMGILSQGLRIAPPEAPVTGYMYGKGVYFADCSSKSANYCHASPTGSEAFLLLCEVAIGVRKEFTAAEYMDEARPGTHSTMGVGRYEPDTSSYEKDEEGVVWPLAPLKDTGRKSALLYNEFIVYDTAQLRIRYMVHLKFNFK